MHGLSRCAPFSLAHAAIPAFTRQSRRAGLNGNADPFPSGGASQWRRHAFATRRASRHARATNFPQWRNIAAASFRQLAGRVSLGDDEIKIVAHRVAGHGLPHAMRTRRAPRPGVARLRTPEVTSASGQPSQRCAKTRDGGARRDHRGTSSQGRAPSSHDDRGTRRNALSGVMIKRAFRPLWRDRIERASGNYEQISSQGPLVGALPSGQTETGHGNRPENSALGHVTSSYLRLRQKCRAEHDVGLGEGDRTCGRPHGASLARSVIPLSMPAGRQTIFEGLKSDPDIYASAAVTSSRCNDALDAEGALWRYLLQNAPQFAMAPPRQDSATRQAVERVQGRMVTRRDGWPDDNRANPVIPGGTDIFTSSFSPETLLAGQANIGLM